MSDEAKLRAEIERLKAEVQVRALELDQSKARVTAQEQAGNMGLWELNPATGEGSWSPKMYELYHLDPEAPPPTLEDGARLLHPEDVPRMSASLQRLLQTGHAPTIVFRTNPELGPVRHLRVAVTCVRDHLGGVKVFGAVTDVTKLTRVEGELATSSRKLEALFDHSPYNILAVEPDHTISFINRMHEGTRQDLVGQRYDQQICKRDRSKLQRMLDRVFLDGEHRHGELEDLSGRRLELRVAPLHRTTEDRVECALVFTIDVTEQRKLEEQMRHAQKLESLGVLAGGIAHDFNNLLVGILGNAELAQLDLPTTSPARDSLEEILTSAHRAADLCHQMLAYSGKGRFVVEAMDLPEMVREMAHLLDASISKRASLRYDFHPDTAPVEGDMTQIRQVVMNLLTNAADALGDADGIITIATGTMNCDAAYLEQGYLRDDIAAGNYTFIEVCDTGCGMDRATVERMFEPFYSSKSDGRGLGLAAVLGIVRSHDGAIRVHSELGKGTSIKVLLPTTANLPNATRAGSESSAWVGSGTLLIVDDEPSVRRLASRTLERAGFDVLTAEDGVVAVELYRQHKDKIVGVLLDMTMPRLDGKATFGELRKLDSSVRVLLSSGYDEQDATSRFAGKGLAGFIHKPYRASDSVQAFRALLSEG